MLGFVSGAGRELALKSVALDRTDSDAIQVWSKKYCNDHPLDNCMTAAIKLVVELKARTK
jgi:hypothetical protein